MSGDFISNYTRFNDQNYINVILRVYDERINEWVFIPYLITYYKSRGKIDAIYKDGKLITLDKYVDLLNIIEATGYKFTLDI